MSKLFKKDVGTTVHKNGVIFRVWAPFAQAVAVTGSFNNWDRAPMESEGDGYWVIDYKGAEPGQEYKFYWRATAQ
jgi:1,4-alpha-glucan branching enzyme